MSKVDAQRSLRDARYARFAAARKAEAAPAKSAAAKSPPADAKKAAVRPATEPGSDELFSAVPATEKKATAKAARPDSRPFTPTRPGGEAAADTAADAAGDADVATDTAAWVEAAAEAGARQAEAVEAAGSAKTVRATEPVAQATDQGGGPGDPDAESETAEELCGHRSMNGRSCTRVKGHEQKNHRYN
jgi:hypothetical protein